ncbi:hypothetical protein SKAU_G00297520 [Synaphobranchus kaupii]|uniref:BZIP domain-containing protein n=1 Tax=Synaphobranchus kaupii TaxID=118154 RepID=A0A9Q1EV14_SYNKA|nr:hypothetical protein SKAU_G00297520 [Synaphobranchus kaupii]
MLIHLVQAALDRISMEKMARPLPMNSTFLPPTHGVLKSLLENPLKLPFHHDEGFGKEKEKTLDEDVSGSNAPQSAFLGPTLWDKTLPYDGDTFQLEYMDLEEFLSENGIPSNSTQHDQGQQQQAPPSPPPTPSVVDLSSHATTSIHTALAGPELGCLQSPNRAVLPPSRNTPSPIDPETIQVPVGYEPDPADLALSSVPGQEIFDPRKRKFSAEELKPQPHDQEGPQERTTWRRSGSRDARRLKENQIAIRAGFLEKENGALRLEVADLRKELGRCKNILAKYEARHGHL